MATSDASEWVGVIHATAPYYMKGASDLTIRHRLKLAMYRQNGRLEFNQSGTECVWQVEFSQPTVEAYGDGGVISFENHDAFRQLSIDWRGYVVKDTMSIKQRAMNKGNEALINLFQTKNNRLTKSLQDTFCAELYKDGEATGRENTVHGIETFLQETTPAVGDRIATPNDTYGLGSLSTVLGNDGGSWSSNLGTYPNATLATDWPDGQGDSEYDYLSPKLVNWSSNAWGTGATTWRDNCWRAISQTITWLTVSGGPDGMPDICTMASNLFHGYKEHEESIRRINIPHQTSNDLGFKGLVLNQDGVAIQPDFDCPADTAYMENTRKTTVSSLMPQLFWMEGPDRDPRTLWSWLWGNGFYGNVKYQPKTVAKLKNYAAS